MLLKQRSHSRSASNDRAVLSVIFEDLINPANFFHQDDRQSWYVVRTLIPSPVSRSCGTAFTRFFLSLSFQHISFPEYLHHFLARVTETSAIFILLRSFLFLLAGGWCFRHRYFLLVSTSSNEAYIANVNLSRRPYSHFSVKLQIQTILSEDSFSSSLCGGRRSYAG